MPIILQFPMSQNPPIVVGDISRYQAYILPDGTVLSHFDFDKYIKKSKIIRLRGGVANDGIDFEYQYNLTTSVEKGVFIESVYHYTKLWKNLDGQANIIKETYDMAKSIAPNNYLNGLTLDIETNDGLNKTTFTGNAEKLVNKVYSLTGIIPNIYTRAYFWNANTYVADWMKFCQLWVAHHFSGMNPYAVPIQRPYIPDAWGAIKNPVVPTHWQFDTHDNGKEWGSTGDDEIDLNFFTYNGGTKSAWSSLYGVPYPEPETEPPPPTTEDWRVMVVDSMNIRNQPLNLSDTLVGRGIINKRVKVVGTQINGYVPVELWLWESSLKKV